MTISRRVMAKKAIFKMAPAAISNFKNFNFWSRDCHLVPISAVVYQILSKSDDFSLRFSDLQNGGRTPSWICYDVTILHRRTHFRCANIVLKFLVDRCCSFRDTCNILQPKFGVHNGPWQFWGCASAVSRDP